MSYLSLLEYLNNNRIEYCTEVDASQLVSIKIGGNVSLAVYPRSILELVNIVERLRGQRYFILGNGTNCYFSSNGYDGVVVVTKNINSIKVQNDLICADCGASLCTLCNIALKNSLSGLEFAYGIPATVGGAVYMNASAYGSTISNLILRSTAYDLVNNKIVVLNQKEHLFDVKNSVFRMGRLVHLNSTLQLKQSGKAEIFEKMQEFSQKRRSKQPLNVPSAGCVFVNPKDCYSARLIEECGLKGYRVGGAEISTKHAGFIVNMGNATSCDINELIEAVKKRVFEKFNVKLNQEIIYVE